MENNDLREQYQSLTLKELENIRINAVLEKDAKDILMAVILEKMKDGGTADAIHQIQRDEEDKQIFNSKLKEKHQLAVKSKDISVLDEDEINILTKNIILTTETFVAELSIEERLEIITAECVYGMNVFRDFFASMTDFFGGRSKASQKVLRDARKVCLSELKKEALLVGADAVVGVDLDYSEISGGGKAGMLLLVASGTAVRLKQS